MPSAATTHLVPPVLRAIRERLQQHQDLQLVAHVLGKDLIRAIYCEC